MSTLNYLMEKSRIAFADCRPTLRALFDNLALRAMNESCTHGVLGAFLRAVTEYYSVRL